MGRNTQVIAAVLHDLHLAEAKGTGIRAMRRLATEAGLTAPEFHSDRQVNEFKLTLFLHNLLTEDDHAWLRSFAGGIVSGDEAKVLIYARETGAVDNSACRDFCGLDTLAASQVLRRLRDRGLLEKQGAGSQTHYVLTHPSLPESVSTRADTSTGGDSSSSMGGLAESPHVLASLPPELQARIQTAGVKPRKAEVHALVLALCQLRPFTAAELCQALNRSDAKELRRTYLRPMRDQGLLELIYPETEKHPRQAYRAVGSKRDESGHA